MHSLNSILVLTLLFSGTFAFAQDATTQSASPQIEDNIVRLPYDGNAKISYTTLGPDHDIWLRISGPIVGNQYLKLGEKGASIHNDPTRNLISVFPYLDKHNQRTYVFSTDGAAGSVSYIDLSTMKWKTVNGNLGCLNGFNNASFFIASVQGEIYLQAYCPDYHELYGRKINEAKNDWNNRFGPTNPVHPLSPKAVATETNFYTFYIQEENQLFYYLNTNGESVALPLPKLNGKDIYLTSITGTSASAGTDGSFLISVTAKTANSANPINLVLKEEATSGELSVVPINGQSWSVQAIRLP